MTSAWILGNFDASQFYPYTLDTADQENGTPFTIQDDGLLTGLRWCRTTTDVDQLPAHLRVWDVESTDLVYEADPVPDDGTIGWQVHAVTGTVSLTKGHPYVATAGYVTHRIRPMYDLGRVPPPDYPGGLWVPIHRYTPATVLGNPIYDGYNNATGIDAQVTVEASPGSYLVVDEIDYAETLKWTVAADKYRLVMSTITQWQTAKTVEGLDVRRIVGFWQPIYAGSLGKRFQVDSPTFDMIPPDNTRMDGLLLDTSPGSAGHVQALLKI